MTQGPIDKYEIQRLRMLLRRRSDAVQVLRRPSNRLMWCAHLGKARLADNNRILYFKTYDRAFAEVEKCKRNIRRRIKRQTNAR